MDVEDAAGIGGAQVGRQDLHVARQHHRVALRLVEQPAHRGEGLEPIFRRHRHVMKGNAVPFDEAAEAVVIRDHAGDLDVQLACLPARQQVVQAMFLGADQDRHALFSRRIGHPPVHPQGRGQRREAAAQLIQGEGQRGGLDLDAHEITAIHGIGMEARFENPAVMAGDEAGDPGDDPDLVGTGGGQRVEAFLMHQSVAAAASIAARNST